jgi:hypothetical protein
MWYAVLAASQVLENDLSAARKELEQAAAEMRTLQQVSDRLLLLLLVLLLHAKATVTVSHLEAQSLNNIQGLQNLQPRHNTHIHLSLQPNINAMNGAGCAAAAAGGAHKGGGHCFHEQAAGHSKQQPGGCTRRLEHSTRSTQGAPANASLACHFVASSSQREAGALAHVVLSCP